MATGKKPALDARRVLADKKSKKKDKKIAASDLAQAPRGKTSRKKKSSPLAPSRLADNAAPASRPIVGVTCP